MMNRQYFKSFPTVQSHHSPAVCFAKVEHRQEGIQA